MKTIWRIENEEGIGCYVVHLPELERMYIKHGRDKINHPIPRNDIGIKRYKEEFEICGFINKEQALNWFNKYEIKKLKTFGFNLKEIKVAAITAIGKKQILAVRTQEELKERMSFELPA
jgi:hypothetical protein